MASPLIFNGDFAKSLKSKLNINDNVHIITGELDDPTSVATDAPKGSLYIKSDDGVIYRKIDDGSTTAWEILGAGSGGSKNYISDKDSRFESGLGAWEAYNDPGSDYVSGTGGSGAIAIALTSLVTEKLEGKQSLKVTKGAFDSKGEGVSILASGSIDRADQGKTLLATISGDFSNAANDGDWEIRAYDLSNGAILHTGNIDVRAIKAGKGLISCPVYLAEDTESVRLSINCATTDTSSYDFFIDEVKLSPMGFSLIKGSEESAVFTGAETVGTGIDRIFDPLTVLHANKSTITGGKIFFSTPGKFNFSGYIVYGNASTGFRSLNYKINNGSNVRILGAPGINTTATTLPFSFTVIVNAGDYIELIGRQSTGSTETMSLFGSMSQIDEPETNVLTEYELHKQASGMKVANLATNSHSSASFAYNTIKYSTVAWDDNGSYDPLTGKWTCDKAGRYKIRGSFQVTLGSALSTNATIWAGIDVSGGDVVNGVQIPGSGSVSSFVCPVEDDLELEVGDEVSIFSRKVGTQSVTSVGDERQNHFSVQRIMDLTTLGVVPSPRYFSTKFLSSDLASDDTDILTMKYINLTVGEPYTIRLKGVLICSSGIDNLSLKAHNDAVSGVNTILALAVGLTPGALGTQAVSYVDTIEFIAESDTIIVGLTGMAATADLLGNGTISETHVTLTTAGTSPILIETNRWDV